MLRLNRFILNSAISLHNRFYEKIFHQRSDIEFIANYSFFILEISNKFVQKKSEFF